MPMTASLPLAARPSSLSVRIDTPTAAARKIAMPRSFGYISRLAGGARRRSAAALHAIGSRLLGVDTNIRGDGRRHYCWLPVMHCRASSARQLAYILIAAPLSLI